MTVDNYRRLRTDRGEQGADKLNPGLWGKSVEQGNPVAATPPAGSPNAENVLAPEQVSGTAEGGPATPEVDLQEGFGGEGDSTDKAEGTSEEPSEEGTSEEPSEEPSEGPSEGPSEEPSEGPSEDDETEV